MKSNHWMKEIINVSGSSSFWNMKAEFQLIRISVVEKLDNLEQKMVESESTIANLEEEVQDLKNNLQPSTEDIPEVDSILKDIKTNLILNSRGRISQFSIIPFVIIFLF